MKNTHYEIHFFTDETIKTTDRDMVENLIDDLEAFERDDVNMITIETDDGELVDVIWTEESGITGPLL